MCQESCIRNPWKAIQPKWDLKKVNLRLLFDFSYLLSCVYLEEGVITGLSLWNLSKSIKGVDFFLSQNHIKIEHNKVKQVVNLPKKEFFASFFSLVFPSDIPSTLSSQNFLFNIPVDVCKDNIFAAFSKQMVKHVKEAQNLHHYLYFLFEIIQYIIFMLF